MRKSRNKKNGEKKFKLTKIKRIDTGKFVDRELSLLEFNNRVLQQAMDEKVPILERVKFLSIFQSNIDEFFMKRVDITRRIKIISFASEGGEEKVFSYDQHKLIRKAVNALMDSAAKCYSNAILPSLKRVGIEIVDWKDLQSKEKQDVQELFDAKVFPILTPLSVDPGHPFPHISNLSTSLAVSLRYPGEPDLYFARVKIPKVFPRWIHLNPKSTHGTRWLNMESLVWNNLDRLFPNMEIVNVMPFRVTRNIELEQEEEEVEDILEMVEQALKERRFGSVVKLEVPQKPDPWLLRFLMAEMEIVEDDVYEVTGLIDYTGLMEFYKLNINEFKYQPYTPVVPKNIADEPINIFHAISESDILVHHPYESYESSVEHFLAAAAVDPNVLAIKIILYRTGEDSGLIKALIRAAESGKLVVCLIEVKARMDEERNITWAQQLEGAGVHIVYGLVGLKTHCKIAQVVRQEDKGINCYCHIGTGNYNAQTARLYTDLGLFTSDPQITKEIVELFHHLTGRSQKREYKSLLVAPTNMKSRFLEFIEREIKHAKKSGNGHIVAKCNGLEDQDICHSLYAASSAGVKIELLVRGVCTLKPGVPGLSENIRVISVVDRFLEHSRIYYFRNGESKFENGEFYIGSADWMSRNLERRVEVCVPIVKAELKSKLSYVLQAMLSDRTQAWEMKPDGSYKRLTPSEKDSQISSQRMIIDQTLQQITKA